MGQSNSKKTYNHNRIQGQLIDQIQSKAKKLSDLYTYEFLDENFCNRLALIYNDRLTKFRKQEIDNVQFTLGIVNDNPTTKRKVCELIVNHYIKRIKLISKITADLEYGLNRIYAVTLGPICTGQPEVFDGNRCAELGGRWLETVFLPDDSVVENRAWYQQTHDLQTEYIGYLKRLNAMLRQLEDFDEYVNDEKLDALDLEVEKLTMDMRERAFQRYRMILATPTYTKEQIREKRMREETLRSNYAAKSSALRVANGLPPLKMR